MRFSSLIIVGPQQCTVASSGESVTGGSQACYLVALLKESPLADNDGRLEDSENVKLYQEHITRRTY
jgi:hypothetical protein